MKHIAIFINSYNDFDHILPFIDYVALNKKDIITLYRTKNSNMSGCESHLNYIKNTYNLYPVNYDDSFSSGYLFFISLYRKFGNFSRMAKQKSYLIPFFIIFTRLRPLFEYFTRREISKTQKNLKVDVLMMDFGKELSLFGRSMVKQMQNNGVFSIGYLHGYSIYTNTDTLQKDKVVLDPIRDFVSSISKPKVKRLYFDRYVVGINQKYTNFCSSQQPDFNRNSLNRVFEVGIPRFSHEWINKYKKKVLRSEGFSYGNKSKLNVVLFMSHPQYNVLVDELMATIKALSLCDSINFVYKPHTRNGLDRISLNKLNGYNASDISSLELSSWADVGIVYGSSIAFQLLQDNTPMIMPTYIHTNSTIFEKNDVCIVVNNVHDLLKVFDKSKEEIHDLINKSNINDFISYYVYGNNDYDSLMNNFYNFSTSR